MMKSWICAVLVFLMVFGNASVCHAVGYPQALEENHMQVCELRATRHFGFSVKANGKYYIANALSLENGGRHTSRHGSMKRCLVISLGS